MRPWCNFIWGANCTTPTKNSKINTTRINGTALGHMNLKCPQIATKLNINEQYDGGWNTRSKNPKSSFKNRGAQYTRGRKLRDQIRYSLTETQAFQAVSSCYIIRPKLCAHSSLISHTLHTPHTLSSLIKPSY